MGTLLDCIKIHGKDLDPARREEIVEKFKKNLRGKFTPAMAGKNALLDVIGELEAEHTAIFKKASKMAPKEVGKFASAQEPKKEPGRKQPEGSRKPLITESQKKRMAEKVAIKKKQIAIEDAKEARGEMRGLIIRRRKKLNLATYKTNAFVNSIEQVTTKKQREVLPFIIEKTGVPKELKRPDLEKTYAKHQKDLEPIADYIQTWFNEGFERMKRLMPDMSAQQIENYVTHIWDLNKKQKQVITNWFTTQNRFLKKRYIATLKEGIKEHSLTPRTLDIGEIIRIHDSVMNRAIENKQFVENLKGLKKDGVPLIARADEAPVNWVLFDHPALRRVMVIPGKPQMGEKVSPELKAILDEMGVAIGRRISPTAWGKPVLKAGEYKSGAPPEVRFQRFMSNKTIAHEIGHHIDTVLDLGDTFLNNYKSELYAVNKSRIEAHKGMKGKYGAAYAESTAEQIAEFFATLFTDAETAAELAPSATADVLERLKQDGVLSKLVDFDFEKKAKNLIEEQLNTMLKLPVKVHPDLVKPMKVVFDSRIEHPAIQAYEVVNGSLKKSILSLSLFHHAALGETGIATMGALKTANIYFNPVKIYNALVRGKFDVYEKIPLAKRAVGSGVQLGATHDIPVSMIQDKLNALARKTKRVFPVNLATKFMATFNQKWDMALWDYLHDSLKLYAFEALESKMNPQKDLKKQRTEIAQFVNDTFGGQNWDMLMVSPKTIQIMTWSLLSADWTTSTMRQALAPTGIGKIHKETVGLRRRLGVYFWIKAAIYFGVGINMLNYTFRKWDEEKNPQYYKDKEMTFWDRTMAGNSLGKRTNLFVGRYEDGSERYIRWGKQFRELAELFFDDTGFSPISATLKKAGSKLAPVIQLVSQITTGMSPSGFKNDDVYGKKGWDKTLGIFKTLAKAPVPFSMRRLLDKDREAHVTDLAFPSSRGMSRYRSIELFKHAITTKDERLLKEIYQDTLQNNLPAFTLFNAAITSLKAQATKEANARLKEIEDIKAEIKKNKDPRQLARLQRKLMSLIKENVDKNIGMRSYETALNYMKQYNLENK
jgi:hypothetical protein